VPAAKISYAHKRPFKKVYQFRITLLHLHPHVWRTIQVPKDYSFWDLHIAITDCMPWLDYHLHEFRIKNPRTGKEDHLGIPDEDFIDDDFMGHKVLECSEKQLSSYFSLKNPRAMYLYDFGDGWIHEVVAEKILPPDPGFKNPVCLAGENACPPEDCGGIPGYYNLLEILGDRKHPEYRDMKDWMGGKFDPAAFKLDAVNKAFKRLKA
jgi:hypothetical protein